MGYAFHIERLDGNPIAIEDWQAAVDGVDSTRVGTVEQRGYNPSTGETIVIAPGEADVEVYFPTKSISRFFGKKGSWHYVFRYYDGYVSFRPAFDIDDGKHPVRLAASELANRLSARVVGDDGEEYDW